MALPAPTVLANTADQRDPREHEQEEELSEQCRCGEFLRIAQERVILFAEVSVMEQFKQELVAYLAYYNTEQIKLCLGGLPPAVYREKMRFIA